MHPSSGKFFHPSIFEDKDVKGRALSGKAMMKSII